MTPAIDTARPAALFPGQGSQVPGMRENVETRAPDLLERCLELVGEDPFARVDESTRFAQPAIFCASLSAFQDAGLEPGVATGHSLGELAALTAAGVFAREDALELVVLRGRLMADADPDGSMIALIGGTPEDAAAVAEQSGVTVANDNAPGQIVLSGPRQALARAEAAAGELGRRTLPVDVAGAFHSPSMRPAMEPFRAALDEVEVREPRFAVISCATTRPFEDVRAELTEALVRPVRWRETMLALHAGGVRDFVETGPGKLLARMGKRILPDCPVTALEEHAHA
ncbi:MAG TPA: ACP S-malonyltransferase [Solirubrobacteraceae bacterium]|nr:ACP S-malonyltransferase [Solirubrobacteraceae bacterium]